MFFSSSFVRPFFLLFLLFRPALLFCPLPPIFPARELFTTANNSRGKNVVAQQHHLFSSVSFILLDYKNIRHDNSSNAKWLVEYPIHQVHLLARCFLRTSIFSFILLVRLGESRDAIEPLCFFFSKLKSTHGWKDRVKRRRELEAMNNGSERRIYRQIIHTHIYILYRIYMYIYIYKIYIYIYIHIYIYTSTLRV